MRIPGSKSHTIRAVVIASLAEGESRIRGPLAAADTLAAANACRLLGAAIEDHGDWTVRGVAGRPRVPDNVIDVGNSGTTLYIALGTACLVDGVSVFTGDEQIRRRPAQPLIDALNVLGGSVESTRANGRAPIIVRGPMCGGGPVRLDGSKTSQFLSSLLINCPLAPENTTIEVSNLIERPYVEMTLQWLEDCGIKLTHDGLARFSIPGSQVYRAFDRAIPADFSSATFFMCAAAITGSDITLHGLDMSDTQGDRVVAEMLGHMGASVQAVDDGIRVSGGSLHGAEFDLADTPDALPAMAVTACFAEGETRLVNVAQARLKETDRITAVREELAGMGADIDELPDGLVIRGRHLRGAVVSGRQDHRIVMALAIAGLAAEGETIIHSAEALDVTFPNFVELMQSVGARVETVS